MYTHLVTFRFRRMVHTFTCTGLTETQYHNFGEAAGIGSVMDKTIDTSELLSILFTHTSACKFRILTTCPVLSICYCIIQYHVL